MAALFVERENEILKTIRAFADARSLNYLGKAPGSAVAEEA